jgi:hypothetical protein
LEPVERIKIGILNPLMEQSKPFLRLILLFAIVFLLSGCLRPATSSTVDLSQFTPQSGTPSEQADTEEVVTPTPKLDSATQTVLRIYPLWIGSSWVYDYIGYTLDEEIRWRVTETVVDTQIIDGYYVARVERKAELREGEPADDFPYLPEEGVFYYLIDGSDIYRSEGQVRTDLTNAWLDLVIPFPEKGDVWYPDPEERIKTDPSVVGSRYASAPYDQGLPEDGTIHTCYNVATQVQDGKDEGTFCEGVGYVYQEATIWNTGVGFRSELIGFSLQ